MKLLFIDNTGIHAFFFNPADSARITAHCQAAGKQWSNHLLGFFINATKEPHYAAITIKGDDGVIESMEYLDVDTDKPEFAINKTFIQFLTANKSANSITFDAFAPLLNEMTAASTKARRWEVYPIINQQYQSH